LEGEERLFVQILLSFFFGFFSLNGGRVRKGKCQEDPKGLLFWPFTSQGQLGVLEKEEEKNKKGEKRRDIYYPFLSFFL
jgi:hypothetical protein